MNFEDKGGVLRFKFIETAEEWSDNLFRSQGRQFAEDWYKEQSEESRKDFVRTLQGAIDEEITRMIISVDIKGRK